MSITHEIKEEVNSIYRKLIILSAVLFLIADFLNNKIMDGNSSNVILSFWGFLGVIICREIMVFALVTVFLIVDCKTIRVFGTVALSSGTIIQAILSVISLIMTLILDIRPGNWFLCIIGVLISVFIYVLCICNLISFYLNIQRLLLLCQSSESLEAYHKKQVDIASEYNPVVEKYYKMNLEIEMIGEKLGRKYKYKTIFPIDIDDYPSFNGYVGLFDSDDIEIIKYAGKVKLYGKKVDIQSTRLDIQIENIENWFNIMREKGVYEKLEIINDEIEFLNLPVFQERDSDIEDSLMLFREYYDDCVLTLKSKKYERKIRQVI